MTDHQVPAPMDTRLEPVSSDIIKEIAMDIGKEVASHIETMYPKAVEVTSKSMLLSVRNKVYNEIMAALSTTDESEIRERLAVRKAFRRRERARWKHIRETDWEAIRAARDV